MTGWTTPKPVSRLCSHNALSHASEVADRSIAVCIAHQPLYNMVCGEQGEVSHHLNHRQQRPAVPCLMLERREEGCSLQGITPTLPATGRPRLLVGFTPIQASPHVQHCASSTGTQGSLAKVEGDRQGWESLKIKDLKYTKCNTLEKV